MCFVQGLRLSVAMSHWKHNLDLATEIQKSQGTYSHKLFIEYQTNIFNEI